MEQLLEGGQPLEPLLAEMEMYRSRAKESFAYVFSSEHTIQAHHAEGPADPEQLASIEAAKNGKHTRNPLRAGGFMGIPDRLLVVYSDTWGRGDAGTGCTSARDVRYVDTTLSAFALCWVVGLNTRQILGARSLALLLMLTLFVRAGMSPPPPVDEGRGGGACAGR